MLRARLVVASGLGAWVFVLGCGGSYVPRPSPRLSIVQDGFGYGYYRDGKRYEGGLFGGDIVEAVHGNPQAEEYARQFKGGTVAGFVVTLVGTLGVVGGLSLFSADAASTPPGQSVSARGPAILLGGAAVELVGILITANAAPHLFDAINVYNDGAMGDPSPPSHPPAAP
jgi:hypothetical protein